MERHILDLGNRVEWRETERGVSDRLLGYARPLAGARHDAPWEVVARARPDAPTLLGEAPDQPVPAAERS